MPRSWPVPLGGDGDDHSTCNWQSPNSALVLMAPVPAATTIAPDSIFQPAGCPRSVCHLDRSVPLNSTTESDGGAPGVWSVLKLPGVTIVGCGRAPSWTCHLPPGSMGVSEY